MHTNFPLLARTAARRARVCHTAGKTFRATPQQCSGCHASDDPHKARSARRARVAIRPRRGSRPTSITRRRASRSRAPTAKRRARIATATSSSRARRRSAWDAIRARTSTRAATASNAAAATRRARGPLASITRRRPGFRLAGKHQQLKCEGLPHEEPSVAAAEDLRRLPSEGRPAPGQARHELRRLPQPRRNGPRRPSITPSLRFRAERRAPRARVHDVSRERRRRAARQAVHELPRRERSASRPARRAVPKLPCGHGWARPSASTTGWRRSRCSVSTRRSRAGLSRVCRVPRRGRRVHGLPRERRPASGPFQERVLHLP